MFSFTINMYIHIIIRLQMKKKVFSCLLKQIMIIKINTFLDIFLRRHLRVGYIRVGEGFKHTQHPFPNPCPYPIFSEYYIIEFDVLGLATY